MILTSATLDTSRTTTQKKVRQDTKMMTPSFPSSILVRSMKQTCKKMGGSCNGESNHNPRGGFWHEFAQAWKWLNMLALPAALVFIVIMLVVEVVSGNLVTGVVLGLATLAAVEVACTIMALSVQTMLSIFDWIDK